MTRRDNGDLCTGMVLHCTAVWRSPDGELVVIAINEHAPRSAEDARVLAEARAGADVIVTTGAILRAEPDLRWEPPPPHVAVVTRGEIPEHAALQGCDVIAVRRPLRDALPELRALGTVLVEAGPTVARTLYQQPLAIDELRLSIYDGPLAEEARAPGLIDEASLWERLPRPKMRRVGDWLFGVTRRDVHLDLAATLDALARAGNPIAWSRRDRLAEVARRRWGSLRRRKVDPADPAACIRDVMKGLIQAIEEDPRHVGPEQRDYEEVAERLVAVLQRHDAARGD